METLYVVATPIGNLEDITIRAIKVLLSVPVIACEDTRHTGLLLKLIRERYGNLISELQLPALQQRFISVRDWNEKDQINTVMRELELNDVALVSDAGTPLLSDPGFKVVREARKLGVKVVPIPGAFAGATALSAAGLPTNIFKFWGFLPKKYELEREVTHIIYESPLRIQKTIEKISTKYPNAQVVVARELTKIHEYIGPDDGNTTKGEVTLLVYRGDEVSTIHGEGQGDLHDGKNSGGDIS